jgi:hypothetical protein
MFGISTVDVDIDIQDIIDDIPTDMLEEELSKRKKLIEENPKKAQEKELFRAKNILYPIEPDDYDLISSEAVTLANFDSSEMIYELEHSGYRVLPKDDMRLIGERTISEIANHIRKSQNWRIRDFLCDLIGVQHTSSKETIIEGIKELV